jgi:TRAP-type C4-dicarboxylate transport system permease small subunit
VNIARAVERGAGWLTVLCGWWLLVLTALTCLEMLGRKLLGFSLQGVDELGGFTLAVTSALAFSYTLLHRGHTRVDFMLSRLPAAARSTLNCLAMVTLALFALFAAWRGFVIVGESIEMQAISRTPLKTPMWLPQALWLFGWGVFAALASVQAVHAFGLLAKDRAKLNRLYGTPTLEEEIEAETGGTVHLGKDASP